MTLRDYGEVRRRTTHDPRQASHNSHNHPVLTNSPISITITNRRENGNGQDMLRF